MDTANCCKHHQTSTFRDAPCPVEGHQGLSPADPRHSGRRGRKPVPSSSLARSKQPKKVSRCFLHQTVPVMFFVHLPQPASVHIASCLSVHPAELWHTRAYGMQTCDKGKVNSASGSRIMLKTHTQFCNPSDTF